MNMRILLTAAVCLGFACAGSSTDGSSNPSVAAGPAATETCADYIVRVAPGVQCLTVDAGHCQCGLNSVGGARIVQAQPTPPQPTIQPQPSTPGKPGGGIKLGKLVFDNAPSYTTVKCVSGPCPTSAAVMISVAGYPEVPIAGVVATVRLEIAAPNFNSMVLDQRVNPGDNPIHLALVSDGTIDPKKASVAFDGAPAGTLVNCQGARCPDPKQHPIAEGMSFNLGETDAENKVIFAFNAPGFRTKINVYIIKPGRNRVPVKMDALSPDSN